MIIFPAMIKYMQYNAN